MVRSHLIFVTVALAALAGCSSSPRQDGNAERNQPTVTAPPATARPVAASGQETETEKLGRLLMSVVGRSVYFDYDDFAIGPESRQAIEAHANVLNKSGRGALVVEGNADERGSREYNLALGQKRATAVANALKTLGVAADKIEAISFGKEKPRAVCHEEKCWAENRRVDFTYKLK